jgi:hypothetical protein
MFHICQDPSAPDRQAGLSFSELQLCADFINNNNTTILSPVLSFPSQYPGEDLISPIYSVIGDLFLPTGTAL